ncbi:MAG TPA: UvrB/UvrC motif-containing protein [Trebonia sp.]|jgi:hypothetical protein|nr:UvrB/UvrC motif-containing protein [Trebonia sp.]
MENAIEVRDFENAAVLRDREQGLLGAKAARLQGGRFCRP